MFKIRSIEISGFWNRHNVSTKFNDQVNVIIGKNGTGKTTFMNILQSVLAVDLDGLYDNQFDTVTIILADGDKQKTIKATRIESHLHPISLIEYKISSKKFQVPLLPPDDVRRPILMRKRAIEQSAIVRDALADMVSLASLSVYRIRNDVDFDIRDRNAKRYSTPVDARLSELTQQLTHYQLELSQSARDISVDLQKKVLISLLYEKSETPNSFTTNFNEVEEKSKLTSAYKQLGVTGPDVNKRINEHVSSIDTAIKQLKSSSKSFDIGAFEAKLRTEKVVKLSLDAEEKIRDIYKQIDLFLEKLSSFISDKKFSISGGDLKVVTDEQLPLERLSSGEKQLLILLIEALLQRKKTCIFIADEPELSLHIAWQKKIVPAVIEINPNAQIIVATHSPEIAGRYSNFTIDMEDMING